MKAEVTGVADEYGVGVVLLDLGVERGLRLRGPDRVMVSGEHYDIDPIGNAL